MNYRTMQWRFKVAVGKKVHGFCRWVVAQAGLNVDAANHYIQVQSITKPDRPDLEEIQKRYEDEIVAKDAALAKMQAQIDDLDRRLRRSDPIVAQAVSQDQNSVTYAMVRDLFKGLQAMEGRIKALDKANGHAALIDGKQVDRPE